MCRPTRHPIRMPTILRTGAYRSYFFSPDNTEPPHVLVERDNNSARFWLRPVIVARNLGFSSIELRRIERMIRTHQVFLLKEWSEFSDAESR